MDIAIDLGTSSTLIYIKGKGVVYDAPSVVAVERDTNKILKIGKDAETMLGRSPGNLRIDRPISKGVVAQYDQTLAILRYCIRRCSTNSFFKPNVLISVPSGITEVEERAVCDASIQAGAKRVYLIEEPIASALGAGIDISKASGNMIVNIGGGTADIASISLGEIIASESIPVGGDILNSTIAKYMRRTHNIIIGEKTAEEIKIKIGSAWPFDEVYMAEVNGRCSVEGIPKKVSVSSAEIYDILKPKIREITDAVCLVIERTPPELVTDISKNGIILTGAGSLLFGIDRLIEHTGGIRTYLASNPAQCAVIGAGRSLDNLPVMQDGVQNFSRKHQERL